MSKSVSTGCTIPITDQNKCLQTNLIGDIKIIAAYLAVEHTPACMDHMLEHVKNAVKTLLTSNQQSKTVCKLSEKIKSIGKPLYATAAAAIASPGLAQSRNSTTKAVPTRHKQEIIVTNRNPSPT